MAFRFLEMENTEEKKHKMEHSFLFDFTPEKLLSITNASCSRAISPKHKTRNRLKKKEKNLYKMERN